MARNARSQDPLEARESAPSPSRRLVLAGGGFALAFTVVARSGKAWAIGSPRPQSGDPAAAAADGHPAFAPNAFIRIDKTGPVRLVMANIEMGQGAYTGQATLMAEELDIGLDQLSVEHAPPNEQLYAMPALQMQATGGSTTIRGGIEVFREAGAVARTMLVSAAAQQWSVDPASCSTDRGVVHHAASGRSAAYGALADAASRQPVPQTIVLKDPKTFKLIGKPWRRLDTAGKVDGSTQFGIDVRVPDMMIAAVATCPVYGGKLKSVNEAAARAVPGVKDVVRLDNAVAVTGPHYWAAKTGLDALDIQWDLGPNVDLSSAGLTEAMDEASRTGSPIVARQVGDLSHTGKRIEAVYQLPALAHAPMEPLNAVVQVRPDACEIWLGTQVPTRVVDVAVKVTGLSADKIIVHNQYLGGGFGRRLEVDSVQQAVAIAKQVPYPVKLIWSREQDIQQDIPRPPYYDRIAAVVDDDGYPLVWTDRVTSDSVGRRWAPVTLKNGLDPDTVEGAVEPPYDLPNLKVEWVRHDMPGERPVGWWRGVGPTHNLFKVESFIDELAHAAGKDPIAYRRTILKNNPRALGVLNLAAEKIGWNEPVAGERIGRGVALGAPFGSYICAIVETEVTPLGEIQLRRAVAAVDCGLVINPNTVEAQIQGGLVFGWTGALYSELTYENGAIVQSNFNDYRMMRMNETPPIEVHIVGSAKHSGGIGEVGTAIAAPALANAVFAATGVRIRKLPIDRTLLVRDKDVDNTVVALITPLAVGAAAALALDAGRGQPLEDGR